MLALRLKPELEKRLTNLATKTGRTKTFYERHFILKNPRLRGRVKMLETHSFYKINTTGGNRACLKT